MVNIIQEFGSTRSWTLRGPVELHPSFLTPLCSTPAGNPSFMHTPPPNLTLCFPIPEWCLALPYSPVTEGSGMEKTQSSTPRVSQTHGQSIYKSKKCHVLKPLNTDSLGRRVSIPLSIRMDNIWGLAVFNIPLGWNNGSAVKRTFFFCNGPEFASQHPRGSSPPSGTPVWVLWQSLLVFIGIRYAYDIHSCMQIK